MKFRGHLHILQFLTLTSSQGESYAKTHQVDLQEKRKLVQLVQLQQQEVEALKQVGKL